jgi:hypothetical protein
MFGKITDEEYLYSEENLERTMRMDLPRFFLVLIMLAILMSLISGCTNNEIASLSIQAPGDYSTEFEHDGQPVEIWTDLDVEYIESTKIWYQIEFFMGGNLFQSVICDPLAADFRLMPREAEVRGVTKMSYLAPMDCEVDLPAGLIEARVILQAQGGQVKIFRADLIINYKE